MKYLGLQKKISQGTPKEELEKEITECQEAHGVLQEKHDKMLKEVIEPLTKEVHDLHMKSDALNKEFTVAADEFVALEKVNEKNIE